jgi:hypothetical protein
MIEIGADGSQCSRLKADARIPYVSAMSSATKQAEFSEIPDNYHPLVYTAVSRGHFASCVPGLNLHGLTS